MRIDAHVHYAPPELLADLSGREPYWDLLLGPSPDPGPDLGRLIADMDAAGLDRVVVMGNYWRTHEMCVANNSALLELLRLQPDRIIAFAALQPAAGQAALDELQRCLDGGMKGVGELGPYGQGFDLADARFLTLAETCAANALPLNLHANEPVGHFYPGKSPTPLLDYCQLAQRYPELKLILAHWGGGLPFYEIMPEVRRALRNVFYDTAASPLLYPTAVIFPAVLAWLDPTKILYGSDYPLPICRKRQRGADFRPFLDEIAALGLETHQYDAILGNNAQRLFDLAGQAGSHPVPQALPAAPLADLRIPAAAVVSSWPETRDIFDHYRIPWQGQPAPSWEPIEQAAAARGIGRGERARLLADLNAVIKGVSKA